MPDNSCDNHWTFLNGARLAYPAFDRAAPREHHGNSTVKPSRYPGVSQGKSSCCQLSLQFPWHDSAARINVTLIQGVAILACRLRIRAEPVEEYLDRAARLVESKDREC
jgi:hypothetical protein